MGPETDPILGKILGLQLAYSHVSHKDTKHLKVSAGLAGKRDLFKGERGFVKKEYKENPLDRVYERPEAPTDRQGAHGQLFRCRRRGWGPRRLPPTLAASPS